MFNHEVVLVLLFSNLHTAFHSNYIFFQYHQQDAKVPISLLPRQLLVFSVILIVVVILMSMKWYLTVVVIRISLMITTEKAMAPHSSVLAWKIPWMEEPCRLLERLHFHFSLSCIGEGNGNPLQCSCLGNPRDGGAWWAPSMGSHRVGHN